ncbi:hypothetical protein NL676_039844 [Syzygium grande]|nr:hypothetical protein NL676_039844 [Syzygium grande]
MDLVGALGNPTEVTQAEVARHPSLGSGRPVGMQAARPADPSVNWMVGHRRGGDVRCRTPHWDWGDQPTPRCWMVPVIRRVGSHQVRCRSSRVGDEGAVAGW